MSNAAAMRKSLETAHELAKQGIYFVPVPVLDEDQKQRAIEMVEQNLGLNLDENE